jgi:hypothetical protein
MVLLITLINYVMDEQMKIYIFLIVLRLIPSLNMLMMTTASFSQQWSLAPQHFMLISLVFILVKNMRISDACVVI